MGLVTGELLTTRHDASRFLATLFVAAFATFTAFTHQGIQVCDNSVGEFSAGRLATHVPGANAVPHGFFHGGRDAPPGDHHAGVVQHPRGRSDNARRVDDRFQVVLRSGHDAIVFAATVAAIAVIADGAEHGHFRTVRGSRHRGRSAGHHAANGADERAVQAGGEQHVVPFRFADHVQAERVQLLLFVHHFRVAGAHFPTGLQEQSVRQPHHVRLVKRRDLGVTVLGGVFERRFGHVQRAFPRHHLDGLHDACAIRKYLCI